MNAPTLPTSATPRTDAKVRSVVENICDHPDAVHMVPADFARGLERELANQRVLIALKIAAEQRLRSEVNGARFASVEKLTARVAELASSLQRADAAKQNAEHLLDCERRLLVDRNARIAELEAALAAAPEDSARLDWVEREPYFRLRIVLSWLPLVPQSPGPGAVRSAIDAARKAAP